MGSHGRCVSRGRTRLSYALKKSPVDTEGEKAIRAGVRGQGSNQEEEFGDLDRGWLAG